MRWLLLPSLLLPAAGCRHRAYDFHAVCLGDPFTDTEEVFMEADEPLMVFSTATGGGCTHVVEHSCEAVVVGGTIEITTFTETKTRALAIRCESDLVLTGTSCETPPLAAGVYTVRYADLEAEIQVPSVGPTLCLDGSI